MAFMPQVTFTGSYFIAGSYFLEVGDTGQETMPALCGAVTCDSGDVHTGFLSCSAGSFHISGQGPQSSACNTGFLVFEEGTDQRAWLMQLRQTFPKVLGTSAHSGPH